MLLFVFSCGFTAFLLGVTASERTDIGSAGVFVKIYYTIGLFVLGGLDIGMPQGGSAGARGLLWFAYFAAPTITAASVIEGILRAIAPERWQIRRLRQHIVVAGGGGIGRLCLKRLRKRWPHKPIVVIDLERDHPAKVALLNQAHVMVGDIRAESVLDTIRLDRCERVFLLTGDDFANLDVAAKILERRPRLAKRTVVHVANLQFLRVMSDSRIAHTCEIFNSHDIAGKHLVTTALTAHFERTAARDVVILAGFGRFGQSVLDNLQIHARDCFRRVIVMDLHAHWRAAIFGQQVGFAEFYDLEVVEGDLRDPQTWKLTEGIDEREPVFILGSGDDGANLRTALWLKRTYPEAHVVARTFQGSSFASELGREGGFEVFSVAELVAGSMPSAWFGQR